MQEKKMKMKAFALWFRVSASGNIILLTENRKKKHFFDLFSIYVVFKITKKRWKVKNEKQNEKNSIDKKIYGIYKYQD